MSRKRGQSIRSYHNDRMEDELRMSMMNQRVIRSIPTRSVTTRSLTHKKKLTHRQQIQLQTAHHMSLQMKQLASRIFNQ